jgi:hypothetical protein
MIPYKLIPQNFFHLQTKYNIIRVTIDNYHHHYRLVENTIQHFKDEIDWEGMFDTNVAIKRLNNGMVLYLGICDSDVFGHVWFDDFKDGRSLFNLFVRNDVLEKNYTGKEFVSDIIFRYEYDKIIYCEVDEWNEKSIRLFNKLGFIIY